MAEEATNGNVKSGDQNGGSKPLEQRSASNGFMFHTPFQKGYCDRYSFGPKSKNSTQMALFFTDGAHTYSLSPANYSKIRRCIAQANDIGKTALNVALVSGDVIEGKTYTEFLWKYAKIAVTGKPDDQRLSMEERPRVLLCHSIRKSISLDKFEVHSEYGMYVSTTMFEDASRYLFVENNNNNLVTDLDF